MHRALGRHRKAVLSLSLRVTMAMISLRSITTSTDHSTEVVPTYLCYTAALNLVAVCRYQVCLFCFERIKRDCSNLCPGCRTEYGSEKDPFQKGEVRQRVSSASSSAGVTPQKSRAPTSQRSSPMPSPSGRQTARSQDTAAVLHEGRQSTSPEPSKVPFPGTQNLHGQLSMDAEGQEAWEKTAQPDRSSAAEQEEGPYQEAQRRQPQDATMSTAIPGSTQQAILSNDDISRAGVDEDVAKARSRWLSASQALQNAAMRVGWGSWRFQKRRCDTPQTDPEVCRLFQISSVKLGVV